MANQVYICGTLFHIYVSILKSIFDHKKGCKSLLIINDHTPGIEDLIEKLKEKQYFDDVILIPFFSITQKLIKTESYYTKAFLRNKTSVKYVEQYSDLKKHLPFISESEINLFYNLGLVSNYFIINFPNNYMRLLEDGYRNYNPRVKWFKAFKRKYILRTAIGEGRDDCVKSIEVQFPERLPIQVRHKGKKLEFVKMQENLTPQQKNNLLSVFLGESNIQIEDSKNLILITQPLSEDRNISEDKKIKMYKGILEKYKKDYKIFIKTHPRELTNYKSVFDFEFTEIPRSFPMELLNFFQGVHFNLGITVFSSAIDNLKCITDKIILGKEYMKNFKSN